MISFVLLLSAVFLQSMRGRSCAAGNKIFPARAPPPGLAEHGQYAAP
jgi:hypothetical protein